MEFIEHGEFKSLRNVYREFVGTITNSYKRNAWEFQYLLLMGFDEVTFLCEFLERYLKHNSIPYTFRHMDGCTEEALPSFSVYRRQEKTASIGLFHIYPDTERELFIYFFVMAEYTNVNYAFVACRSVDDYNNLVKEIKIFFRQWMVSEKLALALPFSRPFELFKIEKVTWDDVILPPALYRSIRLSIENFFRGEGFYKKHGLPFRRGVLLAGPPGNGKTMLCKAIANEMDLPFILFELRKTDRERDLKDAFMIAEEMAPSILCFEDLDSLDDTFISLSSLLNQIDGMNTTEGVLILATTNKPEQIDPALSNRPSRFDSVFRIEKPDEDCRRRMLRRHFGDLMDEQLLEEMVRKTRGFSMAYLKELYILSVLQAIQTNSETPTVEDIYSALDTLKRQIRYANKPVEEENFMGFDMW
ncbi:MAG: ATP-binding protein [Nitrospirae bacterium]|nr:MAG: ATP-binding protein [Nitrospirota bacterium]